MMPTATHSRNHQPIGGDGLTLEYCRQYIAVDGFDMAISEGYSMRRLSGLTMNHGCGRSTAR